MKISIIIPIYKVDRYLRQCLESVINQTYSNLEIILVDDGSPDTCAEISSVYAAADTRIVIINKENRGLSDSRKIGLQASTGEFVMFLDGDDWVDCNTLERCVKAIEEENGTDCLIFSYVREYPQKSLISHVMEHSCVLEEKDVQRQVYRRLFGLYGEELRHPERLESMGSCCMKLYRRERALQGRFFDTAEVGSCEDTLFNIYALCGCKKIQYLDEPLYHYRKTGNSITSSYRPKLVMQWNHMFDLMEAAITEKNLNTKFQEALQSRIVLSVFGIGMNELCAKDSFLKKRKRVKKYICSERYQEATLSIDETYMPIPWRLLIVFAKHRWSILICAELKAIAWVRGKL